MYTICSTYPPALYPSELGTKVVAGTIRSLMYNGTPVDYTVTLPTGVTLADFHWVPLTATRTSHMRSYTVQGKTGVYTVTVNGTYKRCTCPGFAFRKRCKHIK